MPEAQSQVLMLREQVPLTTQTHHLSRPKALCSTSFIHYLLLDVPSALSLLDTPFLRGGGGAGDCHQSPEVAERLRMVCADSACHRAMANHSALWVVPALLITIRAGCLHVLPQEPGQTQQKTALVLAQCLIVLLMHVAPES